MARPFPDPTKLPHCPSGMGKHPVINTGNGHGSHHKHHLLPALIVLLVTAPCTVTNAGVQWRSAPCLSSAIPQPGMRHGDRPRRAGEQPWTESSRSISTWLIHNSQPRPISAPGIFSQPKPLCFLEQEQYLSFPALRDRASA